ncbi:MAG: hypothetical protein LUB56_00815 [Coprobacillus sp.]|nr:hypothetical protein [Coprobacillus sp.]
MEDDNTILEPLDEFRDKYRPAVKQKAREYFNSLVNSSDISPEKNREDTKEYESIKNKLNLESYQLEKTRALRVFMVVLITLGAIMLVTGAILIGVTKMLILPIVFMVIGAALILTGALEYSFPLKIKFYSLSQHVNQTAEDEKRMFASLHRKISKITKEFDYDLPLRFISEVIPSIKLDPTFSDETMRFLDQKYNILSNHDINSSFKYILPGTINGNPFLYNKNISMFMGTKIYTGSIIIFWDEEETDSDGNTYTVHESETLTASVERPYPYYSDEVSLVYFSDAAPHLIFTRDVKNASESRQEERRLQRYATQATKNGEAFTPLSNTRFETMFHAWDRNNEVEFRLLFTPLAQENILKQLDSSDDHFQYQFIKNEKMNTIIDPATQSIDLFMDDSLWEKTYSLDTLENTFVDYIDSYFTSFYYSLLPILSIPLYQQYHPEPYKEIETTYPNYSPFKYEELVNSIPFTILRPRQCDTDLINKPVFIRKIGKLDYIRIDTYAYYSVDKTDYISVYGGDGEWHDVPVDYKEYYPSENVTYAYVRYIGLSQSEYKEFSKSLVNNDTLLSCFTSFLRGYLIIIAPSEDEEYASDINEALTTLLSSFHKE